MIKKSYPVHINLNNTPFQDCEQSGLLFFDIETTGLSARSSSLYLIGAAGMVKGAWTAIQWFAETPQEESAVLSAFLDFAKDFSQVIHFNGDRFDLPYLAEKCRAYRLDNTLNSLVSRDLYRMIKPLKTLLGLISLKQKSLEEFLGVFREDRFSGGELISIYRDYTAFPNQEVLSLLLLHNYEDLQGMFSIIPMLSYLALPDGSFRVAEGSLDNDSLIIRAWLPAPVPKPFSSHNRLFYLSCAQNHLALSVPGRRGSLKHFYSDYKNYYYLPAEDTAIHKSVAVYVDKEYREPARACNCYTRKDGFYLPQKTPLFQPVFQVAYSDKLCYFPCTDTFLQDRAALQRYLEHLLSE